MSILSNKKFLAIFAMVAQCLLFSCSIVDAQGVRGEVRSIEEGRFLKSAHGTMKTRAGFNKNKSGSNKNVGKHGGFLKPSGGSGGTTTTTTSTTTTSTIPTTPVLIKPAVVLNAKSVAGFAAKCPTETSDLDRCVGIMGGTETEKEICFQCVVGLANMKSVDIYGLNSCSNPEVMGGRCKGCYEEVVDYYNCGKETNLSLNPTGVVDSKPVTTTTTTTTGSSSGGLTNTVDVTLELNSQTSKGLYAPISYCPDTMPKSGDACSTEGYDFLECMFEDEVCTCRFDSPYFLCIDI